MALLCLLFLGGGLVGSADAAFSFSSVFGDHMVLQRMTTKNPLTMAAVYGGGAPPGGHVAVTLRGLDAVSESAGTTADADGSWKVLLQPKKAGGAYSIQAKSGSDVATLNSITFGDVWFCSGQSNMELNLHFTFEKNDTYAAVGAGKYKNIRFFHLNHNPQPYRQMAWLVNSSSAMTNWTVADENAVVNGGHGDQCPPDPKNSHRTDCTMLDQFSAACFYFAQSLSDRMVAEAEAMGGDTAAAAAVPLGMIESAYGGTTIEQWVSVDAQLKCENISCHANSSIPYSSATAEACTHDDAGGNGGLWGGMTAPFVNMTLTGWTWYQGENNLFATAGTTLPGPSSSAPMGSGYACLLRQQMDSWREAWSATPHTTSPDAPFGIVQLADATDEGWGCNMRQMHWAESGNYGVVPNPVFKNAFVAAAHDLGEPWDDGCKHAPYWCCTCMNKTRDPHCHVGVDSPFDPVSKFPWLIDIHQPCYTGARTTPQLMGGVHPSTKIHVGHRLAQAAWSLHYDHPEVAWTGPVVSACGIEAASGGKTLRVEFNTSLLGTDKILVRNYSKAEQASATFVRLGEPLPGNAWENLLYHNRAPYWGDDSTWHSVDISSGGDGHSLILDLAALYERLGPTFADQKVTGVKYGQGIPGMIPQSGHKRVCCGTRDITSKPCPPDNCPVSLANGKLPAMPFTARVLGNGQCQGLKPQLIAGLDSTD